MRELEFRIWDNNYDKYDTQALAINQGGEVFIPKSGTVVNNAIIEQYTGLRDKNGVKIFEGDVLEMIGSNGCSPYSEPYCGESRSWLNEKFVVVCNNSFFHGRHVKGFKINEVYAHNQIVCGWQILQPYDFWNCSPWMKVIGNIHENEELLK